MMAETLAIQLARLSRPMRKGRAASFAQVMAQREQACVKATSFDALMGLGFEGELARREAQREKATPSLMVSKASVDEEERVVRGWASVVTKNGEMVVDSQGDTISLAELKAAARAFIAGDRGSLRSHAGTKIGEVVESAVLDFDMQKALGIDLGMEGWLVAIRVDDDAVWAEVKQGALMAFSIGGFALVENG